MVMDMAPFDGHGPFCFQAEAGALSEDDEEDFGNDEEMAADDDQIDYDDDDDEVRRLNEKCEALYIVIWYTLTSIVLCIGYIQGMLDLLDGEEDET